MMPAAPAFSGSSSSAQSPGLVGVELETQKLREEQARLQQRKDTLTQLKQIEEEEERLRQQIAYAEVQGGLSSVTFIPTQPSSARELNA
jgi:hypothetical protein